MQWTRHYCSFWVILAMLLTAFAGSTVAGTTTSTQQSTTTDAKNQPPDPKDLLPVVLTSRNFGEYIGKGKKVWLVEVYAPWCSHCVAFSSTYDEIAAHFHSQPTLHIGIAKIDGDAEKALAARFQVHSFPSFFVIDDGWNVYSFEDQARSKASLMKYVQGGYKKDPPLPWYASPLGPVGMAQGTIIRVGYQLSDTFLWLQASVGLSPLMAGMVLFGSAFVGCFLCIVTLAIALTPREKQD